SDIDTPSGRARPRVGSAGGLASFRLGPVAAARRRRVKARVRPRAWPVQSHREEGTVTVCLVNRSTCEKLRPGREGLQARTFSGAPGRPARRSCPYLGASTSAQLSFFSPSKQARRDVLELPARAGEPNQRRDRPAPGMTPDVGLGPSGSAG